MENVDYLFPENEKPLDRMVTDGGFCSIFRTIACIGDSLSSGEFESVDENGGKGYHDMFEYSWGQFIGRACGSKVYNFSRGGMTASEYIKSFAEQNGFWAPELAAQAYIIALGVNDLLVQNLTFGSIDDVKDNWKDNGKTFAGYLGAIIQRYREIQPRAKFFLMTMPKEPVPTDDGSRRRQGQIDAHRDLMYQLAGRFENTYVLDIRKYGPVYDSAFNSRFNLHGHMNPMGYRFTADMVMSYIDYIIRHDMESFSRVGFIGTELY